MTGSAYDAIAHEYNEMFPDEFAARPFERSVIDLFTELTGPVVLDVGCGPGQAAGRLLSHGLDVTGVDLSSNMIEIARERYPAARFRVGSMTSLDEDDRTVDGICAWYSIVHTRDLATVFAEFARVLVAGGWLLLAFQTNADTRVMENVFAKGVMIEFLRHDVTAVLDSLSHNGFQVYSQSVRTRGEDETADQAFVIARRQVSRTVK